MGLRFHTSAWADSLWDGHCLSSPQARAMRQEGQRKQAQFAAFAQDIHSVLYLRNRPQAHDNPPDWSTTIFTQVEHLQEWDALRARCQSRALASGLATEHLLQAIVDMLPEPSDDQVEEAAAQTADEATHAQGVMRRTLRQAVRAACQDVDDTETQLEAFATLCGGRHPGTQIAHGETLQDIAQARHLAQTLRQSPIFQHIATLAGRLQRLASTHKRTRMQGASGTVQGVSIGGDIGRLLPQAIAGLRSAQRVHRLHTLSTILSKQAVQYDIRGPQDLGRGPLIVCGDESGSMQYQDHHVWSKAVALALLTMAHEQRRAMTYLGFNGEITHEVTVEAGHTTIDVLTQMLLREVGGGTNFSLPLRRAVAIMQHTPGMRQADIVFLTDGDGDIDDDVRADIQTMRAQQDLHVYVIGIASTCEVFRPIADAIYLTSCINVDQANITIIPVLARV